MNTKGITGSGGKTTYTIKAGDLEVENNPNYSFETIFKVYTTSIKTRWEIL